MQPGLHTHPLSCSSCEAADGHPGCRKPGRGHPTCAALTGTVSPSQSGCTSVTLGQGRTKQSAQAGSAPSSLHPHLPSTSQGTGGQSGATLVHVCPPTTSLQREAHCTWTQKRGRGWGAHSTQRQVGARGTGGCFRSLSAETTEVQKTKATRKTDRFLQGTAAPACAPGSSGGWGRSQVLASLSDSAK